MDSTQPQRPAVSVVIATLGGSTLVDTIERLNKGTVIPEEILVCIPVADAHRAEIVNARNVSLVKTPFRGQVSQRAAGFAVAQSPYVLQLDDDIAVSKSCIEQLIEALRSKGRFSAVAPVFLSDQTGTSLYKQPGEGMASRLFHRAVNGLEGYSPGSVAKGGIAFGVDPDTCEQALVEVEWLPGGCVMHHKDELLTEDFFPFPGKAFSEDLIHSLLLKKEGVSLYIATDASVTLSPAPPLHCLSFGEFKSWLSNDSRARRYYVQLAGLNAVRMYLFYASAVLTFILKKRPWRSANPLNEQHS